MAIVGLFNMTNALANGYQVEPDVRPPRIRLRLLSTWHGPSIEHIAQPADVIHLT